MDDEKKRKLYTDRGMSTILANVMVFPETENQLTNTTTLLLFKQGINGPDFIASAPLQPLQVASSLQKCAGKHALVPDEAFKYYVLIMQNEEHIGR